MKACYAISYQNQLLEALKATKANGVDVDIIHQLNGADVDWALGAAVVQYISQSHTVVVSDDPLDAHRAMVPSSVRMAAEAGAFIIGVSLLYVYVVRDNLFGSNVGSTVTQKFA